MLPLREKAKLHTPTVRESRYLRGVQKDSEKKRDHEGVGTET